MTDIVERLRTTGEERQKTTAHDNPDHYLHVVAKISQADGKLMLEAADDIARLRAENERMREALTNIAAVGYVSPKNAPAMHDEAVNIARAALTEPRHD